MNIERWRSNRHPSLVLPLSRKAVTFLIKTKMENLWTLIYLHSFHRILNLTFGARQKWCSRPEKKRKSSVLDRDWIPYDKTILLNISKILSAYTMWRQVTTLKFAFAPPCQIFPWALSPAHWEWHQTLIPFHETIFPQKSRWSKDLTIAPMFPFHNLRIEAMVHCIGRNGHPVNGNTPSGVMSEPCW